MAPPPKDKLPKEHYRMNVRGLTGADHDALDAIVAVRNRRGGSGRWSKEIVATELLRAAILRDPDAPAEYVAAHEAEAAKRGAP